MKPALELLERLRTRAYKYDEKGFKLSAGGFSHHFIDVSALSSTYDLHLIATVMSSLIAWGPIDAVGGPGTGSDPISVALLMYWGVPRQSWFSVRKDSDRIRSLQPGVDSVVVIEDVVTTGASSLRAIDLLVSQGIYVTQFVALVDRGEGGLDLIRQRGIHAEAVFKLSEIRGDR